MYFIQQRAVEPYTYWRSYMFGFFSLWLIFTKFTQINLNWEVHLARYISKQLYSNCVGWLRPMVGSPTTKLPSLPLLPTNAITRANVCLHSCCHFHCFISFGCFSWEYYQGISSLNDNILSYNKYINFYQKILNNTIKLSYFRFVLRFAHAPLPNVH